MEWVETTAKSVDEAKELALDELGVVADEAEFEVLETPRPGLFGRIRGEARVRARVRPTPVRPKQERRRGRRGDAPAGTPPAATSTPNGEEAAGSADDRPSRPQPPPPASRRPPPDQRARSRDDGRGRAHQRRVAPQEPAAEPVDIDRVRDAALEFVGGLTGAFGFDTSVDAEVDGTEIEVRVSGESLGLLIGPGGRTLLSIQDLARVAAQRRLGDHETRLRVDVAGYREKRKVALQKFASQVAEQVRESGVARSLDAMPSADRKVLHDALAELDGVSSRSEGEEPNRRVVVTPTVRDGERWSAARGAAIVATPRQPRTPPRRGDRRARRGVRRRRPPGRRRRRRSRQRRWRARARHRLATSGPHRGPGRAPPVACRSPAAADRPAGARRSGLGGGRRRRSARSGLGRCRRRPQLRGPGGRGRAGRPVAPTGRSVGGQRTAGSGIGSLGADTPRTVRAAPDRSRRPTRFRRRPA